MLWAYRAANRRFHPVILQARQFLSTARPAPDPDAPGCFGLKGLHSPSDWDHIARVCVDDCLEIANRIRQETLKPTVTVLHTFDDLSDRLCSVLDVAELCRNVHADPEFVEAANEAFAYVSNVTQHLNADISLYEPLARLYDVHESQVSSGGEESSDLSPEDVVLVKSLKADFERGGINLGPVEKRELLELQAKAESAGNVFLSSPNDSYDEIEIPRTKFLQIPRQLRSSLKPIATRSDNITVHVNDGNSHILLKWITDSKTREKVFRLTHQVGMQSRLDGLDSLLRSRHDLACLLGHESYSKLLFSDRLASSPDEVLNFLHSLSGLVHGNACEENIMLEKEKMRREPHLSEDSHMQVHGWDRSFYIGRLKAHEYNLSSSDLSQYFPLAGCLVGIAEVMSETFGVRLERVRSEEGELWHSSVEKFQLRDTNDNMLGHIFFDLFPREGKYTHAAHFTIRCGRQPSGQSNYQTPVVALVCNFGRDSRNGVPLLTISEYETLFHEFGHSLHSLFSRTKYQHLSGTRVAMDFVEIPSHVFEHFAWDPRVISRVARHYKTGDHMPTRLLKSLVASRNGFIATDIQMQIVFSAMDLTFHGANPPAGNTVKTFEDLQTNLTAYKPDIGAAIPATFHHLVGYGAGYYSYIFARAISAQIWASLFEENPFSRQGGSILKDQFLAFGGSREPTKLIHGIVKGPVSCEPFLEKTNMDISYDDKCLLLPIESNR